MNGITVPANYKHLIRKEYKRTEDYKAQIRHFIEARPAQALTSNDFQELLSTTSAMEHVKRLMKQGYVTRQRLHSVGRGKRFSYKWHETPLDYETAVKRNGFVLTHDLELPDVPTIDNIRDLFFDYARSNPTGGALGFVFFIEDKIKEVKKQREEIINGHTAASRHPDRDHADAE